MTEENKSFGEKMKVRIYNLILKIIKFTESLPKNDEVCRVAINQLIRSGTSICANYVEATAGTSKKDFSNF
ncbi:MAG: four helix bundle protein [Patescibacteria group bacterium]|jgi:four helix bundle protein